MITGCKKMTLFLVFFPLFTLLFAFNGHDAAALLNPDQILLVVNRGYRPGMEAAKYYALKRNIPRENIVELSLPNGEAIGFKDYERLIESPLYIALRQPGWAVTIKCLVLFPGIPLRIDAPKKPKGDEIRLKKARERLKALEVILNSKRGPSGRQRAELLARKGELEHLIRRLEKENQGASVDSELSLLLVPGHERSGWIPNPLYRENMGRRDLYPGDQIMLVSRIDGPDIKNTMRIIDDSLYAEQNGLRGVAYFDARYPRLPQGPLNAYQTYDLSIRKSAHFFKSSGCMPVVLNISTRLFQPGECPSAALYCGWYSLGKYVDAFEWKRGAVAYHIASGECTTLKGSGRGWCRMMLLDGVAATLGPVAEPYLQAFPPPEIFFPLLASGRVTLVEAYFASLPYLSWQMILIGDPLYMPFKHNPCIKPY